MGIALDEAFAFVRRRNRGVLVTLRRDGRPQLSNVVYAAGDDHAVRVSVTDTRAKTKNLRRDPRASFYVGGDDFSAYLVLEGRASLGEVTRYPDDEAADELVALYRSIGGEHPDWGEYRRAMVSEGRLVARIEVTYAYGTARA